MYKEIWKASIGETLSYKKNFADNNFVDVMQSAKSMEILPLKNSRDTVHTDIRMYVH